MDKQDIYQKKGYKNRDDYLEQLAEEHGVEHEDVLALAELLGEEEDFDGLVNSVEDLAERNW